MLAVFIGVFGQEEKTFTLDIKDLRLCTSATMYHRFLRFQDGMKTQHMLHVQSMLLLRNIHEGVINLAEEAATKASCSHTITIACSSTDLFCSANGEEACIFASKQLSYKGLSQLNYCVYVAKGKHTWAYSTDKFAVLLNNKDVGADGIITNEQFLIKVLPYNPDVSPVAVVVTADVHDNPGKILPWFTFYVFQFVRVHFACQSCIS